MKDRTVRIVIETPCAQDFGAMPKAGGGLYCSQCHKVVSDFTQMSDEELIRVLSRKGGPERCGAFSQSQLEQV